MRFCLMIEGQEGTTWDQWLALASESERLGFEGIFSSDHYLSVQGHPERGSADAWTVMAGLAACTDRLRLGTLVTPVTFRHPAVLAKVATTVDRISGGRVEIGMGAGWWDEEHRAHGFPFPASTERFDMLVEQLEIVHGLLSEPTFSFKGHHYTIDECPFLHKGLQQPHPPIIVGGAGGPRMARLVARWADEFNTVGGSPEELRTKFARIRDAVDDAGRDEATVTTSVMTWVWVGKDEASWRTRVERARQRDADFWSEEELARDCLVGTADQVAERLNEYSEAGVQRVMLNHSQFDDLETLEVLATQVFPNVR